MILRLAALALALALASPVQAQDKLTVLLDWFVNPDHAPLVIAREQGFFAEHGLEVELIAPADPNDPPKLVAAGQADIAVSYQPQLHLQVAEGLPLRRIGTAVATPLNSLVVLADGPIEGIADWSFAAGLDAAAGGHYLEVDLYVPEYAEVDDLTRGEAWFPLLAEAGADHVLVIERGPRSYVIVLPRSRP